MQFAPITIELLTRRRGRPDQRDRQLPRARAAALGVRHLTSSCNGSSARAGSRFRSPRSRLRKEPRTMSAPPSSRAAHLGTRARLRGIVRGRTRHARRGVRADDGIRDDIHTSLTTLEWTVNPYSISFAVQRDDRRRARRPLPDRRRIFAAGIGLFALARFGWPARWRRGAGALITARAVQGVGARLCWRSRSRSSAPPTPPELPRRCFRHLLPPPRSRRRQRPLVGGAILEDRVAVDLLAQRPDRPGAGAARADADAGEPTVPTRGSTCPASGS